MTFDPPLPRLLWGTAALLVTAVVASAALLLGTREAEALADGAQRIAQRVAGAEADLNRSLLGTGRPLAALAEALADPTGPARPRP